MFLVPSCHGNDATAVAPRFPPMRLVHSCHANDPTYHQVVVKGTPRHLQSIACEWQISPRARVSRLDMGDADENLQAHVGFKVAYVVESPINTVRFPRNAARSSSLSRPLKACPPTSANGRSPSTSVLAASRSTRSLAAIEVEPKLLWSLAMVIRSSVDNTQPRALIVAVVHSSVQKSLLSNRAIVY